MITTRQAVDAHQALQSLIAADRVNQLILSSAVRIRLAGCLRKTKPHFEEYNKEVAALGTKYGTKDDKGNLTIAAEDPNFEIFKAEQVAMQAEPTDIEGFATVTELDLMGKHDPEGKTKQNQVDIGIIAVLLDVGILAV